MPGQVARTAHALTENVKGMVERYGAGRVGFLTLTFRDHVTDAKEARRRLNSLTTGVIRPRYGNAVVVLERQKSGRIHFHLVLAMPADIGSGCDFGAFKRRDYRSAPLALRSEWKFWRETAPAYGFGRTELLPVKSTAEAMGRYVGKYLGKDFAVREDSDRGVRRVSYIGPRVATSRFGWASSRGRDWRDAVGALVRLVHTLGEVPAPTGDAMALYFGRSWVYHFREAIGALSVDPFADVRSEIGRIVDPEWAFVRETGR